MNFEIKKYKSTHQQSVDCYPYANTQLVEHVLKSLNPISPKIIQKSHFSSTLKWVLNFGAEELAALYNDLCIAVNHPQPDTKIDICSRLDSLFNQIDFRTFSTLCNNHLNISLCQYQNGRARVVLKMPSKRNSSNGSN